MLKLRKPTAKDIEIYFAWVNDPLVREHSYNTSIIDFESHKKWFEYTLNNDEYFMCICQNSVGEDIGQVRIQKLKDKNKEALIGISIDSNHRGKSYAKEVLILATDLFFKSNRGFLINAYIKEGNLSSKLAFENAGFEFIDMIEYENFKSYHFIKK
jgi:RimJ/RimL family protein N-acetyltransferase